MSKKSIIKKSRVRRENSVLLPPRIFSSAMLKIRYKFWILIGVLVLAGIAIVMRIETPVVWTFLYGIGGWAALTTNPGNNLR